MLHKILLAMLCWSAIPLWADQQSYPFKRVGKMEGGKQIVLAQNSGSAPILLNLNLNTECAAIEPGKNIVQTVNPDTVMPVATIRRDAAGKGCQVKSSFKYSIGDPEAQAKTEVMYWVPFESGKHVRVGQAPGGKISTHTGQDSKFAIDFVVPEGTPIVAARAGVVVDVDQHYTEGGVDPALKANHVLILHQDGSLALYSHLRPVNQAVRFGQKVHAGELIGYSGNTGYSSGPHLHFSVLTNLRTPDGSAKYLSHPIRFANGTPLAEVVLAQGQKLQVKHP